MASCAQGRPNPCDAVLLVSLFRHLKLELLTQFPASNDEKYFNLLKKTFYEKKIIPQIELFNELIIFRKRSF